MNKFKKMIKAVTDNISAKFPYRKVRLYVVWNPKYTGSGPDAYQKLLELEEETGSSVSSYVETHDIERCIEAFYNETDVQCLYEEVV